jgi:hypothetical protein
MSIPDCPKLWLHFQYIYKQKCYIHQQKMLGGGVMATGIGQYSYIETEVPPKKVIQDPPATKINLVARFPEHEMVLLL